MSFSSPYIPCILQLSTFPYPSWTVLFGRNVHEVFDMPSWCSELGTDNTIKYIESLTEGAYWL